MGKTYVNITRQQFVRGLVFLQDVVIDTPAGESAAKEEPEKTKDMTLATCPVSSTSPGSFEDHLPSTESAHGLASGQDW
jgi:hypothetical protein